MMAAAILPAISNLGGVLTSIFHKGHADDAIGQADGVVLGQVVSPIIGAILGRSVGTTWMEVDPATDQVSTLAGAPNQWPLTALQTQELLTDRKSVV